MKVCNFCQATIDDSATVCPHCGNTAQPAYPAYGQQITKESISVGGWIGRSLIPMIPLVGWIIYIIMLFIWSGDNNKEDTFRNWAKAQLIIMAVAIVLTVLLAVIYAAAFSNFMSSMM